MGGLSSTRMSMPGMEAKMRVKELRDMKEKDFWGREPRSKRDLPAFWSIGRHGQPFNDERLSRGAVDHWQFAEKPMPLKIKEQKPAGPATLTTTALRK